MWIVAALFNFATVIPLTFVTEWTCAFAYAIPGHESDLMTLRLWLDFGIFVLLFGVAYYLFFRDVTKSGGLAL